jgi:hypothetical protein
MVKVFFGCSMRGGYGFASREELARFPQIIEGLGFSLPSKHQTAEGILRQESKLSPTAIHDRDYAWLMESDLGVFEITNGSIGTGEEISDMISLGKPVLCFYKKAFEDKVSAYGRGKSGSRFVKTAFECHAYNDMDFVRSKIKEFVAVNVPMH